MAINNTNSVRTNVTTNDGLDSFSAEPVETMEVIEGSLINTEVVDLGDGNSKTYYTFSPDVVIRKVNGVEVSRTTIGS